MARRRHTGMKGDGRRCRDLEAPDGLPVVNGDEEGVDAGGKAQLVDDLGVPVDGVPHGEVVELHALVVPGEQFAGPDVDAHVGRCQLQLPAEVLGEQARRQ